MTGYGRAEGQFNEKKIVVELRALNSKQLDLYFKMPAEYKEKEIDLRSLLNGKIRRGKVECSVTCSGGISKKAALNKPMAKLYFDEIKNLENELGFDTQDYASVLVRLPEVMQAEIADISNEEWDELIGLFLTASDKLNDFRITEGKNLYEDLKSNVASISDLLEKIKPLADSRQEEVRARLKESLDKGFDKEKVDESRFEQELIYYLEKMDINEEIVRLESHLKYFGDTIDNDESSGKKLGFIGQEIGREINTMGAKSYNADMQHIVVQMKDLLERIKEQVLNVL